MAKLTKAQTALEHVLVEIDFAEADEREGIATEQSRRIRFEMIRDAARRGLPKACAALSQKEQSDVG